MQMVGDAVDRAHEVDQRVNETDEAFTKARDGHPEFKGKTAAVDCPLENGGFALYSTSDPRSELLTKLGFTVAEEVDEVAAENYYAETSAEDLSMIESYDLLLVIDDCGAPTVDLNEHPTFKSLDIVKRGEYIYPAPASDALSHDTVLSVPYALKQPIPKIVETLP